MKTIGLLGGTGWSSTIGYYTLLNEMMNQRLGGYHSAKILLKSIDYHDIMTNYGKDHHAIALLLKHEFKGLLELQPDCAMICCNSLHKYYDMIAEELSPKIPVLHAIDLVGRHLQEKHYQHVLLLATKFTMEDGFFAQILKKYGVTVTIPEQTQREKMQQIHADLMQNIVTQEAKAYFQSLIADHAMLDAVVLGCTEFPLVVSSENSLLPIVDPMVLQVQNAVDFALS